MQKKEIIFGAPGCGKTRYLMDVLEKELNEVEPERIAFVSFTKKGAEEGMQRAKEQFKYQDKSFKYFRTIHSICFRELRISRYDMMSNKDYRAFSEAMGMRFVGYYTEEFFHSDDRYLHMILLRKNNPVQYEQTIQDMDLDMNLLKNIELNYERYKKQFKKYDFTDLLLKIYQYEMDLDIDVAIIDEAQDLTTLQWKTCEMLFRKAKRVYIAGDDDQAIYEWTGADVNYFLNVEGQRTILHKSWRLKKNLLDFSKRITALIDKRVDKDFAPLEDGGNIYYHNNIETVKFKDDETYYCLARNNYHLREYSKELMDRAKVFSHKGKISVSPSLVRAINNFELYKTGLLDEDEAIYVKKYLRKDIRNINTLAWYDALAVTPEEAIYYKKLIDNNADISNPKILISTIHGVKGGEADNVVLMLDVSRTVYKHLDSFTDSELRCLYVACTRAKTNLHIVYASTRYSYEEIFKAIEAKDEVTT